MGSKYKHLSRDELYGNAKKCVFDFNFSINLSNCAVRIPVPGDGHCILYASEIRLTASSSSNINNSYKALKEKVIFKFLTNCTMYNRYFYAKIFVHVLTL